MADPQVKILISAVDKASGVIKGITGGTGKLNTAFKDLTGISLGAAGGIALLGTALQKGIRFAKESVDETVNYNKTIREMAQVTGLSADAISRIVQVGDDWGISIDAIRTSLAFMNKQGISPSIDNLADLADEYVNTTDKSAFAEKAVKVLGRGYQTLIPILALGGKGFREAAAGIDKSLIASEAAMKASREYEVAMDELSDSATGLKYVLGNELIPTLTKLLGSVNKNIGKYNDLSSVYDELKKAEKLGLVTTVDLIKVRLGLAAHTMDLESVSEEYADVLKKLKTTEIGLTESERLYAIGRGKLTEITEDLTAAEKKLIQETWDLKMAQEEATRAAEDEKQALSDMEWIISQPLTKSIEDFNEAQGDIVAEMGEVQKKIDELNGMEYLTAEQQEELDGLKQEQVNLQTEYDNNATEHEEATKRIVFDLMVEKLAVEGLLTSGVFEDMAEAWGLTEDAEIKAMIAADEATNWLRDHPDDVEGMKKIVEGQATSWGLTHKAAILAREAAAEYRDILNSLEDKVIHITTYHEDMFEKHNYQHGANFTVPPGYPNDSFPFHAESGERVIVIPKGNNTTTNNFSMSLNTNAGASTLIRDFNMMRAMAG